jgi:predicted transcriptional regulator
MQEAKSALNLSQSTAQRALKRLETAGLVRNSGGLYWRTVTTVTSLKE